MAFAPAVWFAVRDELCGDDSMESLANCFDCFDDEELFNRFKLSRPCINFISDYFSIRIKKHGQNQIKGNSAAGMVMAALDYYANGELSATVREKAGLSASETPEIISIVSKVISTTMQDFVTFPKTRDARANVANDIKNFCGIPNVLGVVACLHVKVKVFKDQDDAESFRNTLEYYSAMTQVVCDCEGNFLSVEDCRVGSTPEQSIWDASAIGEQFAFGTHGGTSWIIGGNGYRLSSHLLTALSPVSSEPEKRFNAAHAKGLRAMQETLTSLKRRFRCLANLGYTQQDGLDKNADVIKACCILHNIGKKFSVPSLLNGSRQLEPCHLEPCHLEPCHPGKMFQLPPATEPQQALRAREELIAAHFAVAASDPSP